MTKATNQAGAAPTVNPPLPTEAPAPAPKKKALVPVFAIHKITYGKNEVAVPGSIFTPTSVKERAELFSMRAVRELDATEVVLHAQIEASKDGVADVGDDDADEDFE